MEVELTLDQQAFVRQVIASGRLKRESEVVQESSPLWESRERRRIEMFAALDSAENNLQSGYFTDHTDAMLPELALRLKQEARNQRDFGSNG